MMKIALVVAAGVLTTAPIVSPVKAQGVKMAQVDMQTGRHFEDRDDRDYRDRGRRTTPAPQLASVPVVSPSAHDSAAAR